LSILGWDGCGLGVSWYRGVHLPTPHLPMKINKEKILSKKECEAVVKCICT